MTGRSFRALSAAIRLLPLGGCIEVTTTSWDRTTQPCPPGPAPAEWPTALPAESGLDGAALDELALRIERGELPNLHAVLVVREGHLVFERYFRGPDASWGRSLGEVSFAADTLHDLRSITKSVVGALVGIAAADSGLDLDRPLLEILPAYRDRATSGVERITLRHALTMSAGLTWDETSHPYWDPRNHETAMWMDDDPVRFALAREIAAAPGERFAYNGGLPTVLAAVIERATGMGVDRFARERLFCPLGVSAFEWQRHGSGLHIAASGLRLRPRDIARFGQLMLEGGEHGGVQIVPRAYVEASLRAQLETGSPLAPAYGYQWWIARIPGPSGPIEMPVASGNGGQRIYLIRPARMVVVVTAGSYDSADQGEAPERALRAILAALRPAA